MMTDLTGALFSKAVISVLGGRMQMWKEKKDQQV